MTNGYVYYVSSADDLIVVRNDGNAERVIAENIAEYEMIIDESHIYYLRREYVGGEGDGMGKSLYATDLHGKELVKIAHNVTAMKDYSDKAIQITSESVNDYVITKPVGRKKTSVEYVTRTVTAYETVDKATGERQEIMQLGAPEVEYVYRRRKKLATTVENITVRKGYERRDVSERGLVRYEKTRVLDRQKEEKAAKKRAESEAKASEKNAKREAKRNEKELSKKARRSKGSDTHSNA
jgi:hypothetical protein